MKIDMPNKSDLPIFKQHRGVRDLKLKTKKLIVSKIKEYKMPKVDNPNLMDIVIIPDLLDKRGKALEINSVKFNEFHELAQGRR